MLCIWSIFTCFYFQLFCAFISSECLLWKAYRLIFLNSICPCRFHNWPVFQMILMAIILSSNRTQDLFWSHRGAGRGCWWHPQPYLSFVLHESQSAHLISLCPQPLYCFCSKFRKRSDWWIYMETSNKCSPSHEKNCILVDNRTSVWFKARKENT